MSAIFLKPSGRAYYLAFFAIFMLLSLGLMLISHYFQLEFNVYQIIVGMLVIYLLASGLLFLYYQYQYIHVEDNFITIRQGVVSSKVSVIPISKISEVTASYSLVDRLLGLGTVKLDTAGTSGIEVTFRAIPKESIHTFIGIFKAKKAEGAPQPPPAGSPPRASENTGEGKDEDTRDSW